MEKGRLEEQLLELHKLKVEIQEQSRLVTSLKQACGVSYIYSRTSMAQALMAHSPGLARTVILVPTGHFMHNSPWMAGTTLD